MRMRLPDNDHASRYCKPSTFKEGEVQPTAFMATDDNPSPSVNWLEHFGPLTRYAAVCAVRDCFLARGYGLKPNGVFAINNVGASTKAISEAMPAIAFEHDPIANPPDPSH